MPRAPNELQKRIRMAPKTLKEVEVQMHRKTMVCIMMVYMGSFVGQLVPS